MDIANGLRNPTRIRPRLSLEAFVGGTTHQELNTLSISVNQIQARMYERPRNGQTLAIPAYVGGKGHHTDEEPRGSPPSEMTTLNCRSTPAQGTEHCWIDVVRLRGVCLPGNRLKGPTQAGVAASAGNVQPDAYRRP